MFEELTPSLPRATQRLEPDHRTGEPAPPMADNPTPQAADPATTEQAAPVLPDGLARYATTWIVSINVIVFALMALAHARWLDFNAAILMDWGAFYGPRAVNGEGWRLLTSMFLHGGLAHLFVNMWFLACFGRVVERLLGSVGFLLLYLFAGVMGAAAHLAWFPATVAVGASAAVYGVCGAVLAALLRHRRQTRSQRPPEAGGLTAALLGPQGRHVGPAGVLGIYASLLLFVGFNLVHGYLARENNLPAHLAGFLTGLLIGLALSRPLPSEAQPDRAYRNLGALLWGGCLVGVAWWAASSCAGHTTRLLLEFDDFFSRERKILARCDDALEAWGEDRITDGQMIAALRKDGLQEWQPLQAKLEMQLKTRREPFASLLLNYVARRGTSLHRLTSPIESEDAALKAILGLVEAELFREALMMEANKKNPLRQWTGFPRRARRAKGGSDVQDFRLGRTQRVLR
jgi:membrane associated rhomboid family serine protease